MAKFAGTWHLAHGTLHLVIDTVANGLTTGGLRMSRNASLDDAYELSRLMTVKLAANRISLGGAKAVAVPGPDADRVAFRDEIAQALRPFLSSQYLIGEDLGTSGADVVAIYEHCGVDPLEFVRTWAASRNIPVRLPEEMSLADMMSDEVGGALAGTGAARAMTAALAERGTGTDGARGVRVALQGFGSVGQAFARAATEAGALIVAVADARGCVHDPDGLDIGALIDSASPSGVIDRSGFGPDRVSDDPDAWLRQDVEVVVPAAVPRAITASNVQLIGAKATMVVEGANSPVTREAAETLEDRGVAVVPDVLANAGSAVGFGLVLTGESDLTTVFDDYLDRIDSTVRAYLRRPRADGSPHDRAFALAQDYLEGSCP